MIIAIITALIMAWMLDYAQFAMTRKNYNNQFNGKGCIDGVLSGRMLAPMQYRVAIPWLYKIFPYYETIKIGMMALGLFSMWLMIETIWGVFAYQGMLITGIFYVVNFQFDYIEQYLELGLWAQALTAIFTGNYIWFLTCCFVGAFNRETIIFLPVMYFLATFDIVYAAISVIVILSVFGLIRLKYGWKKSYLDEGVTIGNETFSGKNHFHKNLNEIRKGLKWILYPTWYAILMVALACAGIVLDIFPKELSSVSFVVIPFIILLLVRAMFHEGVRIMLPLLIFIVPTVIRLTDAN